MLKFPHGKLARRALYLALASVLTLALEACGDDNDDPGSQVNAACTASCNATAGKCNLPAVVASDCALLCDAGYTVAPACASTYQDYVTCAGQNPLVACNGSAVTVQVNVPCLDKLTNYIGCEVTHIQACLDLPLDNGSCVDAKLGNTARACVGAPLGCQLLTGVQAGAQAGVGVYCCP